MQAFAQLAAQPRGPSLRAAVLARHRRKCRRGHRHAEQGDRKHGNELGVRQNRECPGGQQRREPLVGIGTQLYDASRRKHRGEVAQHAARCRFLPPGVEAQPPFHAPHHGQLHRKLQRAARDGRPCDRLRERARVLCSARADERRNDDNIERDRRGVGEEELPVRVQDAQGPGRHHEQADGRKHDTHEENRQRTFFAEVSRRDEWNQHGRQHHSGHDQHRAGERQQRPDGPRKTTRLIGVALSQRT